MKKFLWVVFFPINRFFLLTTHIGVMTRQWLWLDGEFVSDYGVYFISLGIFGLGFTIGYDREDKKRKLRVTIDWRADILMQII